jgi:NADH:ubiquinone oxidoreductase subunit E
MRFVKMEIIKVDDIIAKYKGGTENIIPVLQDIQERYYYLPKDALIQAADEMAVPLSRVYSIATFYNAFSLIPKGRNQIKVCLGTTCYVRGGEGLMKQLENNLHVKTGNTTEDYKFSIESVHCLGCCSIAPVVMVNKKSFGRVKEDDIKGIIAKFK